jgi:hypothetical protein
MFNLACFQSGLHRPLLDRVRYRLQYRHTVKTSISTIITIGPSLTGLKGTQLTGSIIYTLVTTLLQPCQIAMGNYFGQ